MTITIIVAYVALAAGICAPPGTCFSLDIYLKQIRFCLLNAEEIMVIILANYILSHDHSLDKMI